MLKRILGMFTRRRSRKASALKQELENLRKNVKETYNHMGSLSAEFFSSGGVCCPSCGVRGYSELIDKQDRRHKRIDQILAKLSRDKQ